MKRFSLKWFLVLFLLVYIVNFAYHSSLKSMPEGTSFEGEIRQIDASRVEFLRDLTYNGKNGFERDQQIFDKIFEMIDNAEEFISIDMFLMGNARTGYRNLSLEMSSALIEKKMENPEIKINFITDKYNKNYGLKASPEFDAMEKVGINVVYTEMIFMRDSNPIYSAAFRSFALPYLYTSIDYFLLYSVLDLRNPIYSVLEMLNLKANHRKNIIADNGKGEVVSLITSANPDDWGSGYSNVALYFDTGFAKDIYNSEKGIAEFSSGNFEEYNFEEDYFGNVELQLLTEGKIKKNLIKEIESTSAGEKIQMAMFLLSERDVIEALTEASNRGVEIELILDSSTHIFGAESKGVPNVAAARDLISESKGKIKILWYNTGNQEFHSKLCVITKTNGKTIVFLGSANYTRRNLDDFNGEMVVKVVANSSEDFVQEIYEYLALMWNEETDKYALPVDAFEISNYNYWKYRFQESTGIGLF